MDLEIFGGLGVRLLGQRPIHILAAVLVIVPLTSWVLKRVLRVLMRGVQRSAPEPETQAAPMGGAVYRSSLGLRLVTVLGLASFLWLIRPALPHGPSGSFGETLGFLRVEGLALSGAYAWQIFALIAGIALIYAHYIWTYRVEIDGTQITYPSLGFARHEADLRTLDRVEDGGAHALRLYFYDGRKGTLIKRVRGRLDMMTQLKAHRA